MAAEYLLLGTHTGDLHDGPFWREIAFEANDPACLCKW